MKNIDLYTTTTIGRTYVKPKLASVYKLGRVNKIRHNSALEDLRRIFVEKGGLCIGLGTSYAEVKPFTIPAVFMDEYTRDNKDSIPVGAKPGDVYGRVILDMRECIVAENRVEEEQGEYGIKSSKYNLTYVNLLLAIVLADTMEGGTATSGINHIPLRAYVQWVSTALTKQLSVTNDFQTVARVRLLCAVYFIARLNDIEYIDDDAVRFISRTIQRHLRLPEEMVENTLQALKEAKQGVRSLGVLLSTNVDHPSFKGVGNTTLITLVGSHINIDGNREMGGIAIDSPIMFAVLLHYSFTRELNARSNFRPLSKVA